MACAVTAQAGRKSGPRRSKKRDVVRVQAGTSIPKYALGVDVSYDPRFDRLVPGYKTLQVALVNNSFNIIAMDPKKDKWTVHTSEGKRKYNAIGDLRLKDPRTWKKLPPAVQQKISYPLLLPIGARQVIDLFVADDAPMETFTQLDVKAKGLPAEIQIMARD
jgi:hypothetical protein